MATPADPALVARLTGLLADLRPAADTTGSPGCVAPGPAVDPWPTTGPWPAADPRTAADPHQAVRLVQQRLGEREPLLLTGQARLRTLLELSAITDPRLFHAMFLHHCMTVGPALDQGAAPADIADLAAGRWIGAALMTELGRGNSSSAIRTEAVYDPTAREFVLHTPDPAAAKHPVNVGRDGVPRLGVVSARLRVGGADRGTALFLVPLRGADGRPCPGVLIEPLPPTVLLPMDYAAVRFDRVRIPYRRWLADGASIDADGRHHDPLGDSAARSRRSTGMSRFACGAVTAGLAAVARASVTLALGHARSRVTVDRLAGELPAIEHLNQQRLLFGALAEALAATALAHRVTEPCWNIPPGGGRGAGPQATVMREVTLAKVTVSLLADRAVTASRSACGALGFFSANRLIDYQALTLAFQSACGDNRLILLDAAWALVTDPGYRPPEDDLTEDPADDPWLRLFRARERLLHADLTAALGLTRTPADARPADTTTTTAAVPFEAWNAVTGQAQQLAQAHATRTAAETVHQQWHAPGLPAPARAVLGDLYQLYCLAQVEPHTGWLLARGLLDAADVLALPERADACCRRLTPHLDALAELAAVPHALLDGSLATPDYAAAVIRSGAPGPRRGRGSSAVDVEVVPA